MTNYDDQDYSDEIEHYLAFVGTGMNSFHLNFPNGNHLSTIWGAGTYSRNHGRIREIGSRLKPMGSHTVEVMLDCNRKLKREIHKLHDGDGSVISYLSFDQWLEIVNQLAAAPKWDNSPYLKAKRKLTITSGEKL